ncbi:uncharacterized protein LOC115688795 [Syzygium oleosum]|uniref:uncharacterized protein LOC115688795 n=1 Tax=Syzygium oleosum TaxID=219896 RepID=UPI0024B8DCE2|nr:uncharacterized protein LOC115688795 [Syzygium oleosum]
MRRAWRLENVTFFPLESGIYAITFITEKELLRVFETGPWSFSSHLLILKKWESDMPPHRYEFDTCPFWVQIHGLPFEWLTEEVILRAVKSLGLVIDMKVDAKGVVANKIGKAKVLLDVKTPLKSGFIACKGGKKLWLDYKFERLPNFCYSCGRLGHNANYCEEVEFKEGKSEAEDECLYGQWLKAEGEALQPFSQPNHIQVEKGKNIMFGDTSMQSQQQAKRGEDFIPTNLPFPGQSSGSTSPDVQMLPEVAQNKKLKKTKKAAAKKKRRYSPYEAQMANSQLLDETQLLDTPIQVVSGTME